MRGWATKTLMSLAGRRAAWRRGRNFAAAKRLAQPRAMWRPVAPSPVQWIAAAGCVAALGGAMVIASHAHQLSRSADVHGSAADAFQPAMPGAVLNVPASPGVTIQQSTRGAFLISSGTRASPAVVVDLCKQTAGAAGRKLLPIRAGYHFSDVARWAARNERNLGAVSLRHVALAAPGVIDMPRLTITGSVDAARLQLEWEGRAARSEGSRTPAEATSAKACTAKANCCVKGGCRGTAARRCVSSAAPTVRVPAPETW